MLDPLYVLQSLYRFVTKCLDKAGKLECSSIAFPVIGTGRLGYPPDLVASCMFQAVSDFKKKQQKTALTDIRFVVYPEDKAALLASCNSTFIECRSLKICMHFIQCVRMCR